MEESDLGENYVEDVEGEACRNQSGGGESCRGESCTGGSYRGESM